MLRRIVDEHRELGWVAVKYVNSEVVDGVSVNVPANGSVSVNALSVVTPAVRLGMSTRRYNVSVDSVDFAEGNGEVNVSVGRAVLRFQSLCPLQ